MASPMCGSLREHYPSIEDLEPFESECWPEDEDDESEDEE